MPWSWYQPAPRGEAPTDDTLELALHEIERMCRALIQERAQIAKASQAAQRAGAVPMLTPMQVAWAVVLLVVCGALIAYVIWCPACAL